MLSAPSYQLSTGQQIPSIGFGTWDELPSNRKLLQTAILTALNTGYRLLDTAWRYETEHYVGEAIRQSGLVRNEIFLVTKVYFFFDGTI